MTKPFSMRVEEIYQKKFKALTYVMNLDKQQDLLKHMILSTENELTEEQKTAYEALLKCWKD